MLATPKFMLAHPTHFKLAHPQNFNLVLAIICGGKYGAVKAHNMLRGRFPAHNTMAAGCFIVPYR